MSFHKPFNDSMKTVFTPEFDDSAALVLPPVGRTVLVQCRGFRCLAFRDADGKWRDANRKQELPEVLKVVWDMAI